MIAISRQNNVRISPRKMNLLANEIRSMNVNQAILYLQSMNTKSATLLYPILLSAVANAKNNHNMQDDLVIEKIDIGPGFTIKAGKARAKGSFDRILKRTTNIRVIIADKNKENNNE